MANLNAPFGFRPTMQDLTGGPVEVVSYAHLASDANAIYQFDLLRKLAASGTLYNRTIPTAQCQTFNTGTPGTTLILGSALNDAPASILKEVLVVDDIDALFIAQVTGATAITVAAHAGKNANVDNSAQTNGGYQSLMGVASASIATTTGLDLRIRDLDRHQNNAEGQYAVVEVLILKSALAPSSAGV